MIIKDQRNLRVSLLGWMVVGPFSRLSPCVIRLPFPASYKRDVNDEGSLDKDSVYVFLSLNRLNRSSK